MALRTLPRAAARRPGGSSCSGVGCRRPGLPGLLPRRGSRRQPTRCTSGPPESDRPQRLASRHCRRPSPDPGAVPPRLQAWQPAESPDVFVRGGSRSMGARIDQRRGARDTGVLGYPLQFRGRVVGILVCYLRTTPRKERWPGCRPLRRTRPSRSGNGRACRRSPACTSSSS